MIACIHKIQHLVMRIHSQKEQFYPVIFKPDPERLTVNQHATCPAQRQLVHVVWRIHKLTRLIAVSNNN